MFDNQEPAEDMKQNLNIELNSISAPLATSTNNLISQTMVAEQDQQYELQESSPMPMSSPQSSFREDDDDIVMDNSINEEEIAIISENGCSQPNHTASTLAESNAKKSSVPKIKMTKQEKEAERQRRLELKKTLEEEKQRKKEERERLAKEKQQKQEELRKEKERQSEEKRKEQEERKRIEDEKRIKKAEEKRKIEEEKARRAEEKRKIEEEKLKQIEEEQKKKQMLRDRFIGFFQKQSPKSKNNSNPSPDKYQTQSRSTLFGTFELQKDQQLASVVPKISKENFVMGAFDSMICHQDETSLYLSDLQNNLRKPYRCPKQTRNGGRDHCEEIVIDDCDIEKKRYKAKLLQFGENNRPPYFGTWRSRSTLVTGRRPFSKDVKRFDYDIDSDDEWEEEEKGESIKDSDSEKSDNEDNDYELDDFFVPHGHLSDDENQEEDIADIEIMPDGQKKRKLLTKEKILIEERTKKLKRLLPKAIGCLWMELDEFANKAKFRDFERHRVVFMNEI